MATVWRWSRCVLRAPAQPRKSSNARSYRSQDSRCHTRSKEDAWSHFKRQIIGVHHWVSEKHLDRYLSDFTFRFNRRQMGEGVRVDALISGAAGRRLTYKALIA
jgi:hypothetical protein